MELLMGRSRLLYTYAKFLAFIMTILALKEYIHTG
jgi:hypothetical protein